MQQHIINKYIFIIYLANVNTITYNSKRTIFSIFYCSSKTTFYFFEAQARAYSGASAGAQGVEIAAEEEGSDCVASTAAGEARHVSSVEGASSEMDPPTAQSQGSGAPAVVAAGTGMQQVGGQSPPEPLMLMLVGMPGSGKSWFANALRDGSALPWERVNQVKPHTTESRAWTI